MDMCLPKSIPPPPHQSLFQLGMACRVERKLSVVFYQGVFFPPHKGEDRECPTGLWIQLEGNF